MATHLVASDTNGMMEKCTVRDIEITKTEIRNCILHYVFIQTSKVFNSKLYNCKVSNSTIEGSEVVDTGLHESDFIKSKLIGCKITTSLLSFCKFVPEIRAMIFKLCLSFEKNKTPALLIALRGDIFLYQQAIRLFYKLNCFTLNYYMLDRCSLMSVNAISNISKLTIDCRQQEMRYIETAEIPSPIVQHSRILHLHIHGHFAHSIHKWLEAALNQLNTVQKLSVERDPAMGDQFAKSAKNLSERFEIKAKKNGPNTWVWHAKQGKALKWKVLAFKETDNYGGPTFLS